MPFLLYRIESTGQGKSTQFTRERQVALAGKAGPITEYVRSKSGERQNEEAIFWEMPESEIIRRLGCDPVEKYAIVIDMKPTVEGNVSLYRLCRIWGCSAPDWTPMAVQLLPLFVDRSEEDPKQFKAIFIWTKEKGEFVHEFLYLQGGTQEGTWAWGRVGSVNGALLWPPIFNHFAREIFKYTE